MKRVLFITPEDSEFGFGLAGAAQRIVAERRGLRSAMIKAMEAGDASLIAVDERLIADEETEAQLRELAGARADLLVYVLPSPVAPEPEAEDYASALIRRTVGYHIRISK